MALFSAQALKDAPVRQVLEPGKYHVRINKMAKTTSRNKGTPGVEFDFEVVIGALQSNGADPQGRHIFATVWGSSNPENLGMFMGRMKALALATDFDFSLGDSMDDDAFEQLFYDSCLQKEIILKLGNEKYNGEERETIAGFAHL